MHGVHVHTVYTHCCIIMLTGNCNSAFENICLHESAMGWYCMHHHCMHMHIIHVCSAFGANTCTACMITAHRLISSVCTQAASSKHSAP